MTSDKFEQFAVGDSAQFSHKIEQADIDRFVEITGDNNPLHVDRSFAEKTSFKGIVSHGMLSASFLSTMIGKHLPGEGALWMSQSINFLLPVRLGDELTISASILKINKRERILDLETEIRNQHSQPVLTGTAQVKVLEVQQEAEQTEEIPTEQKVVLVTGASKGIGAAIAKALAAEGYKIVVNYRSDQQGAIGVQREIEKNGGQALLYKADVTNEESVKAMFDFIHGQWGKVHGLVNNASPKIIAQNFMETTWSDFQDHLDVQVKGVYSCCKHGIEDMLELGEGCIINMGSVVTDSTPPAKWATYTLAKTALTSLTRSIALEFGPKGIRVNTISPGLTETMLTSEIPQKQMKLYAAQTPLRRLGRVDDIAAAVVFLMGPNASYITGENLRINGGKLMS